MAKTIMEACVNGEARLYSRRELIRKLLGPGAYTARIPWEMQDALYYAQLVYPDMTEEEMKSYQGNDNYGRG